MSITLRTKEQKEHGRADLIFNKSLKRFVVDLSILKRGYQRGCRPLEYTLFLHKSPAPKNLLFVLIYRGFCCIIVVLLIYEGLP